MRYLATADLPTAVGPARTITCGRCEEEDEGEEDGAGGEKEDILFCSEDVLPIEDKCSRYLDLVCIQTPRIGNESSSKKKYKKKGQNRTLK